MSNSLNRREFVRLGSGALAFGLLGRPLDRLYAGQGATHKLSFSTLGCPDWTLDKILDFAVAKGYQGIEFRGLNRQIDLFSCPAFKDAAAIKGTRDRIGAKGLSVVDLGSSAEMHHAGPATRRKMLDEAKRTIDLAEALGCPFIRVFPNRLPADQEKAATIGWIAKGLLELGEYAKSRNVSVLMETHGDLVHVEDIVQVMRSVNHPHAGLVWDIYNMWSVTKEPPAGVYRQLKPWVRHTHIKDGLSADGKERLCRMGQGNSAIFDGVDALVKGGYAGYYSFEWEKWWHPELEDPDIAIGEYPGVMRAHFEKSPA